MEIVSKTDKKFVECYDFLFTTGMILPLTLDIKAGDSIDFGERTIKVTFVAKQSMIEPDVTLPAEEQIIYTQHVACIQHRTQEYQEPTLEQKQEWPKLFNKRENTIN